MEKGIGRSCNVVRPEYESLSQTQKRFIYNEGEHKIILISKYIIDDDMYFFHGDIFFCLFVLYIMRKIRSREDSIFGEMVILNNLSF